MIQANELRIGNVVLCDGCFLKIESITKDFTQGDISHIVSELRLYELKWTKSKNVPLADIYPIPLTEEILLKCGFIKSNKNKTFIKSIDEYVGYSKLKFYAYIDNEGLVDSFRMVQNKNYTGNMLNIKYLHQLQNLYFALTGQELEINL